MTSRRRKKQILLHIILILGSVIMALPFIWTLSSSFKDMRQIFQVPPTFIPNPVVFSNYPRSLQALPFGRAYFNSIYIACIVVICELFTASMAAYGFARLKFPGSNILFIFFSYYDDTWTGYHDTIIFNNEKSGIVRNSLVINFTRCSIQCFWCILIKTIYYGLTA